MVLIKTYIPRFMIPEVVFHEFPTKTLRKLPISGRKPLENARNSIQESDGRIRLQGFDRFLLISGETE